MQRRQGVVGLLQTGDCRHDQLARQMRAGFVLGADTGTGVQDQDAQIGGESHEHQKADQPTHLSFEG